MHLHTNNLGVIQAVNGNRADVDIVQFKIHNNEDIRVSLFDLPIHRPCYGDFFIDAKVQVGQECRVHYCEREIETFLTTGNIQRPRYARIHDLADAYIVPSCLTDESAEALESNNSVGLLACMSDMAEIIRTLALSTGLTGAAAAEQAQDIKTKIDGLR